MKTLISILAAFLVTCSYASAQGITGYQVNGQAVASQYNYAVPSATFITLTPLAAGSGGTISLPPSACYITRGKTGAGPYQPFSTTASIKINDANGANSETFVAAGGTLTLAPTSAQFAAYAPVAAGQFFSLKTSLGTPLAVNTDLQTLQFVIVFNQSAAAASLQETPGFYVHYKLNSVY